MSDAVKKESLPLWQLYTLMLLYLLFGSANTLVSKAQNQFKITNPDLQGSTGKFVHPYFQTMNMFIGELACGIVYLCKVVKQRRQANKVHQLPMAAAQPETGRPSSTRQSSRPLLKTKINPLWFAIPSAFDCIASSLMAIGLTQSAASVYQMMRGNLVLITALFSVIFLKRKQYAHHVISLIFIVIGVALVGWSSVEASKKQKEESGDSSDDVQTTTVFGVLMMILAQCFSGGMYITEEKLLDGYSLDPLFVVGWEGFFGTLYFVILLPIFQKIHCTTVGLCSDSGYIEDTSLAWRQMIAYPVLFWLIILYLPSVSLYNATGVGITKFASAAQRSTINSCRALIVWLFGLITGGEIFNWGQLFAFCLLVFGTMVYNEIYIVPIDFMSRNTAKARKQRARENKATSGDRNSQVMHRSSINEVRDPDDLADTHRVQNTSNPSGNDSEAQIYSQQMSADRFNLVEKHTQELNLYNNNNSVADYTANRSLAADPSSVASDRNVE